MLIASSIIDTSALLTTVVAIAAAALCIRALAAVRHGAQVAQRVSVERRGRDRTRAYTMIVVLWTLLAALLLALAVSGPLDILDQLTDVGRRLAREQGWYGARRPLQALLIVGTLVGSVGVSRILIRKTRVYMPRHLPAVIGFSALAVVVFVDALSLHAVDAMMGQSFLAVSVREMLVLIAIVPVVRCAVLSARWMGIDPASRGSLTR